MRGWTRIEKALLLVGLAAVDVWLLSNADKAIYQSWQSWVFDRRVHGEPARVSDFLAEKRDQIERLLGIEKKKLSVTAPRPPAPPELPQPPRPEPPRATAPDSVLGRLSIPRLHLSAMVREGVGEDTLRVALGHIPSTAFPGQNGNVGIAGHRDTLFRALRKIHKDDVIEFETLDGKYAYRVQSTEIVSPKDVGVLKPEGSPELTLVTCYPFYYIGSAPERFIVKARLYSPPETTISTRRFAWAP